MERGDKGVHVSQGSGLSQLCWNGTRELVEIKVTKNKKIIIKRKEKKRNKRFSQSTRERGWKERENKQVGE